MRVSPPCAGVHRLACRSFMRRMSVSPRDVQHLDQAVGHYIISDRPMTEEQWIAERTKVIEAKASPVLPEPEVNKPTRWNDGEI